MNPDAGKNKCRERGLNVHGYVQITIRITESKTRNQNKIKINKINKNGENV